MLSGWYEYQTEVGEVRVHLTLFGRFKKLCPTDLLLQSRHM